MKTYKSRIEQILKNKKDRTMQQVNAATVLKCLMLHKIGTLTAISEHCVIDIASTNEALGYLQSMGVVESVLTYMDKDTFTLTEKPVIKYRLKHESYWKQQTLYFGSKTL